MGKKKSYHRLVNFSSCLLEFLDAADTFCVCKWRIQDWRRKIHDQMTTAQSNGWQLSHKPQQKKGRNDKMESIIPSSPLQMRHSALPLVPCEDASQSMGFNHIHFPSSLFHFHKNGETVRARSVLIKLERGKTFVRLGRHYWKRRVISSLQLSVLLSLEKDEEQLSSHLLLCHLMKAALIATTWGTDQGVRLLLQMPNISAGVHVILLLVF